MSDNHFERISQITAWLEKKLGGLKPEVAVIMGSGLSESVPPLEESVAIPYGDIPGFLKSTVSGHAGKLLVGKTSGKTVAFMQGRFHYYEGHPMSDIAIPIRALGKLGVKTLIVTAAVGSVHKHIKPGDLVVISDHINLMGCNPLRGVYSEEFGPMFPDMTEAYDKKYRRLALDICKKVGISATEGVYLAGFGPSYETPAEIRAFRQWGADVVGMSTVPEVIVARQMGIKVLGLSWITNLASGVSDYPLSHQEVLEQGKKVAGNFKTLLAELLKNQL